MRRRFAMSVLVVGWTGLVSPARAGDSQDDNTAARAALGPAARQAFDLLLAAETYESWAVGEGGELSRFAKAVRTIIREPAAPRAFQALFDRGSPVARLYALTAFWYLRPADYPALVEAVRARDGAIEIMTWSGCLGARQTVAALLVTSKKDAFRVKPGTRQLDAFCHPHRQSYSKDFAGGFEPITIVEGGVWAHKDCKHPPPRPAYLSPRAAPP
jgi:hypothetical protein